MKILYKAEEEDISEKYDPNEDDKICTRPIIITNSSINEKYSSDLSVILKSVDYNSVENKVIKMPYKQKDNKYSNYFRNYKFFIEKIDTLQSASKLNTLAKAIIGSCEVITIKSWQVEEAINMFNSLNSAGLPLSDSDIISAKLYAIAENRDLKDDFIKLWDELTNEIIDLNRIGIAEIDSILMQYMYYIRTIKGETVSSSGSSILTTPGVRRYFTEINKDQIEDPIVMCKNMLSLAKIWKRVSSYSLVKLLLKFNENAKLFLASYFYRFKEADISTEADISEERLKTILECMLRLFALLEISDAGYSSKKFKQFLFVEEVKLANKSISVDDIKADFDNHIRAFWTREDVISSLRDYDGNILVHLNEYLYAKQKGITFTLGTKYDIEHIMPYSGNNIQLIRQDANIQSEDEFKSFVNKLGNKIILEERINRSIGNEWFRTKVSKKLVDKTGYVDSVYPIASALVSTYRDANKPYWNREDIQNATEKACNRIANFIFNE